MIFRSSTCVNRGMPYGCIGRNIVKMSIFKISSFVDKFIKTFVSKLIFKNVISNRISFGQQQYQLQVWVFLSIENG